MFFPKSLDDAIADSIPGPERIFFAFEKNGIIEVGRLEAFRNLLVPIQRSFRRERLRRRVSPRFEKRTDKTFRDTFEDKIIQESFSFVVIVHHGMHELMTNRFCQGSFPAAGFLWAYENKQRVPVGSIAGDAVHRLSDKIAERREKENM